MEKERTEAMNKEHLYAFIEANPSCSFSEIERFFEANGFEYRGESCIEHGPESNVMFWSGWNHEAVEMICELAAEGRIGLQPVPFFLALTFGRQYRLPIAKQPNHRYKELHWCPAVVCPAKAPAVRTA